MISIRKYICIVYLRFDRRNIMVSCFCKTVTTVYAILSYYSFIVF